MSVLNENQLLGASGAGGDYEIEQSLRFNAPNNSYLSKTLNTPTNRNIYTYSSWVKRGVVGSAQYMFFGYGANNDQNFTALFFESNDTLKVGGYSDDMIVSTQLFRDPSAWYHIVMAVDTTQSTQSNRIKMYVNGLPMQYTVAGSFPTQNENTGINGAHAHSISGRQPFNSAYPFDGYMGEINFIDGQALTPDSFGETGDYGEWLPTKYAGGYGTNGFYLTFGNTTVIAATGGTITIDGDYKVHTFTSSGTFAPTSVDGMGVVEYLVIGGGGGSASIAGGGGGAGGYRTGIGFAVSVQNYTVTIGAGGAQNTSGSNSVFSTITSIGGGRGSANSGSPAAVGGSGGGGGRDNVASAAGTAGQGNAGGVGIFAANAYGGGGGGGAGAVGVAGTSGAGGAGGAGLASSITGSSVYRAGGGGGGTYNGASVGAGGNGGGGSAGAGSANTGGGGGAASNNGAGSAGGSGVVIIRYRFKGR